ncbi:hypothetical protein EJB05_42713, partial [Eragrostis curvula]
MALALPALAPLQELLQQWYFSCTVVLIVLLMPLLFLVPIRIWPGSRKARVNLPPGPPRLPILGNLHQLGPQPHRSLRDLALRHGPVMLLQLGMVPTLVVSSAEAAREVMKVQDADCCSRPDMPGARRLSYGHKDVAFAPYGEYWREMRKLVVIELLSMRRVHATWYIREAQYDMLDFENAPCKLFCLRPDKASINQYKFQVDKLISCLSSAQQKPVVLDDYIFRAMDGIIGSMALGNIYGTEQFAYKKHFQDVFNEAFRIKSSFSYENYFPNAFGHLVDCVTGLVSLRERVYWELDAFYDIIIDQHLDPSHPTQDNGPDFIDILIGLMKKHQSSLQFTRDHIKGLLSDVFLGGVDTSSITMTWAMAEMIRKPWVLKKVQDEIRAAVGNKVRVQPDDMSKLRYLKMVIKETMRLHPPAPFLVPRENLRPVKISGYDVPAKTRLLVNTFALGRDPASWDNPEKFDPDRFEGKNVDLSGSHFELVPFGAGRRMCPGLNIGVTTMEFMLANLLYCFDWKLPEGVNEEDISMEEAGQGLTVHKKMPLVLVPIKYERQGGVSYENQIRLRNMRTPI